MVRERDSEGPDAQGQGPLDKRVMDVMSGFPGAMSFQGLRRTLGAHPESLSRVLRRLERDGALERTTDGYRLSGQALAFPPGAQGISRFPRRGDTPIVELRLSSAEDAVQVLGHLAGRWFGEFRWVGSYEEGNKTTLLWMSGTGKELLAMVLSGSQMGIYHNAPNGASVEDESPKAYELLQHVMVALRSPRENRPSGILTYQLGAGPVSRPSVAG